VRPGGLSVANAPAQPAVSVILILGLHTTHLATDVGDTIVLTVLIHPSRDRAALQRHHG
jgi:hypothetical protein